MSGGTRAVLLVDLAATLAAVAFAVEYTREKPIVFAPVLLVTLFLSVLVGALVHSSDRASETSVSRGISSRLP